MTKTTELTTHDADVLDVVSLLETRKTRSIDTVAPLSVVRADAGRFVVNGITPLITDDGVTTVDGTYEPSRIAINHLATLLGASSRDLRNWRETRPGLFSEVVNSLIHGRNHQSPSADDVDPRTGNHLLRFLRADGDADAGILRAVLSDRFKAIDDLDVLMAVLEGLDRANVDLGPGNLRIDVTDRKLYGRVVVPQIAAYAPALLKGYRSPFDGEDLGHLVNDLWTPERVAAAAGHEGQGYAPGTEPVVFAGFKFSTSEVGHGAFNLSPHLVVRICGNGLTINADSIRKTHRGAQLDEGVVEWSDETLRKSLELISAQTVDAVKTFLDPVYLRTKVEQMEQAAEVKVDDAEKTIKAVARKFSFTEGQRADILTKFIRGGQSTAGGVMQAVTAVARATREIEGDPETADELERLAVPVLEFAAAGAR